MSYQKQHDLGLSGLALLRNWLIGNDKDARLILEEIQNLISKSSTGETISVFDVSKGYQAWAETYDSLPNLLLEVEEPIIKSILKEIKPSLALDAACGTGRLSEILSSLGHTVTGIDLSSEMLSQAKKLRSPKINFIPGNLTHLPLKDKSFDLAICALAFTHFPNFNPALSELYRVVRPNGRIIISDIHPWLVALGGQAEFFDKSGHHGYIPNYIHWHSDYFKSFNRLGLKVVQCFEPVMEQKHVQLAKSGFDLQEKTVALALKGLPIALIWVLEKL